MIEVTHLTKRYGPNAAVDDLSFTVEKGQIYGFLGPNGAGKSTTMNILTGYIAPTSGEVVINGHNILEDPQEARKCIGYLPEIPPVYPEMTVSEYLHFAAELKKIPKKDRESMVAEAIEQTGLAQMQGRLIRNLSKGYRQRTGLAQAILGYPDIIILDEPMVGLDPKQIIEIRELIRILGQKHTVILSSHILSEISAICDHIMIIAHGKLVASDTPENLMNLMRGSGSLELTIRATASKIRQMLGTVSEIRSLEVRASSESDAFDVTIKTEADTDIREQVFSLCAAENTPILRMQHTHVSLEDVFLELTEEHPKTEKPKKRRKFGFGGKTQKPAEMPSETSPKTAPELSSETSPKTAPELSSETSPGTQPEYDREETKKAEGLPVNAGADAEREKGETGNGSDL